MTYQIDYNFRKELRLFLDTWGNDCQETMAIEEMSELTKELCKKKRGRVNQDEIVEETADVLITVLQMAEIHGYDAVMRIVNMKMQRALDKVAAEVKNP